MVRVIESTAIFKITKPRQPGDSTFYGRTTAYCHDDLYRLTDEVIFDTPATAITEGCISDTTGADYVANYEYDWVGNRTYETVDGVQTAYQYDQNDRLEQTGGTND